jgi:hypothetical protein
MRNFIVFIFPAIFLNLTSQNCFEIKDSVPSGDSSFLYLHGYSSQDYSISFRTFLLRSGNRYFLKILTKEILYFDVSDDLEVVSEDMSITFKGVTQKKHGSQEGYFLVEVKKNYITTLKNLGITEIHFHKKIQHVSKRDTKVTKKVAECFLQSIESLNKS